MRSLKHVRPVVLCVCSATACIPIPARHQEQVTPAVVGVLRLDDDMPAEHYAIAATDEEEDATCSRPGGRGVSDSLGHFQLPATSEEKKIFWFTLMENPFGTRGYFVCARPSSSDAPARAIVFGHFGGDTLDCLQWRWRDTTRLSCNARPYASGPVLHEDHILRGGGWSTANDSGSYRVLLVPVGRWVAEVRGVVQWVGRTPGGVTTVRAQLELPTRDTLEIFGASLDQVGGAWRVRVRSTRRTRWGNDIWLTYELGPPGEIRELREK